MLSFSTTSKSSQSSPNSGTKTLSTRSASRCSSSSAGVTLPRASGQPFLPEVGGAGQRKLLNSSVLLLGAGGLGSPAAMYLAAAGVGKVGIVDFDVVDASNLQRQLLHGHDDIGRPKVASAAETLRNL